MSDNSSSRQSSSSSSVVSHNRLIIQPKKANPIGGCLRRAFNDTDLEEDENDSLDKLLKSLN